MERAVCAMDGGRGLLGAAARRCCGGPRLPSLTESIAEGAEGEEGAEMDGQFSRSVASLIWSGRPKSGLADDPPRPPPLRALRALRALRD
jgi:hypothetical protein